MSATQTIDLSVERTSLESYLVTCGYWGHAELRRRHAYVLSPSVYQVSPKQEADLDRLARKTYAAVKLLNARLIALGEKSTHLSNGDAAFLKLANSASRSLLRPEDGETRIPPVIKVDLVQNGAGEYSIVEVDVYNPRGFGYAALLEESVPEHLHSLRYPGVAGLLKHFRSVTTDRDIGWHVLVSEFERYYLTAYRVLAQSFSKRDFQISILGEADVAQGRRNFGGPAVGLLAIPESLHTHPELRDALLAQYKSGELHTLYPPVAYLGSKAFLPFLRSCEGMEEFIPSTWLLGKKNPLPPVNGVRVLKASVSSGMKGVYFSDLDAGEFETALEKVRSLKNPAWILQNHVPQEPLPITVFEDDGTRTVRDYYLRVTAYISENGIVDAEVTGRTDRKVHGAPDCIQIPVIRTSVS